MDRMRKYRLLIAASHRVTRWLGTTFPEAIPLVYVCGYPKSGTTWATQLVADYLQLPFPRLSLLPIACPAVVHGHEPVSPKYNRSVYIIRDGRDIMISLYFHLAKHIPPGDNPTLTRKQRQLFPGLKNKDHVADNLPAFVEQQLKHPHASYGMTWGQHVRSFLDRDSNTPLLRYEDLLADTTTHLAAAMQQLTGEPVDEHRIQATVDKFSFAAQSSKRSTLTNDAAFLRNGTSGEWQTNFTPETAQMFDDHCGQELIATGYETAHSWQDRLAA